MAMELAGERGRSAWPRSNCRRASLERTWDYLQRGDVLVRLGLCVAVRRWCCG